MTAILLNHDLREAMPILKKVSSAIKNNEIDILISDNFIKWNGYEIQIHNATSTDDIIDSFHIQVSNNNEHIGHVKLDNSIIEYCIKGEDSRFK